MSGPEIVFLSIILLVGAPAAFFNRTALSLVVSWSIQEAVCLVTGQGSGTMLGLVLDYGVILFVLSKPEVRDCSPYPTMWHQILSFWCERSFWDGAVLTIFPLMWLIHASKFDVYYQWWALWWLALAQIVLAGVEALGPPLRRAFVAMLRTRERPPPGFPRVAASYA
jgi:hypothetical protein